MYIKSSEKQKSVRLNDVNVSPITELLSIYLFRYSSYVLSCLYHVYPGLYSKVYYFCILLFQRDQGVTLFVFDGVSMFTCGM